MSFTADELREEARLCEEEAAVTADLEMRQAIAARAAELALLAEETSRVKTI